MKNISINDSTISLIKLPIGQITYKIDWKEKPHRNIFRKKLIETISINIRKEILIAETLVTQKLWKTIMGTNPSGFLGDNRPVDTVRIFYGLSSSTFFINKRPRFNDYKSSLAGK